MRVKLARPFSIIHYLAFVSFAFASFFLLQNYYVFTFLVLLLLLPVLTLPLSRFAARRILVRMPGQACVANKNESIQLVIEVENPLPFPLPTCRLSYRVSNLFCPNKETDDLTFPLYAKHRTKLTLPIRSYYSGVVSVCLTGFAVWDYLNFLSIQVPLALRTDVIVTPYQGLPIPSEYDLASLGSDDADDHPQKGGNPTEVRDVREYRVGDRLQHIHWKLSSKRDALLVKEHESYSSQQQTLLFELYQDESYLLDQILDLTYSLSHLFLSLQMDWRLAWWSEADYAFKEFDVRTEDDLFAAFSEAYYDAAYAAPHYAFELYQQEEPGNRGIWYVAKKEANIAGREVAHTEGGAVALFIPPV